MNRPAIISVYEPRVGEHRGIPIRALCPPNNNGSMSLDNCNSKLGGKNKVKETIISWDSFSFLMWLPFLLLLVFCCGSDGVAAQRPLPLRLVHTLPSPSIVDVM